MSTTIAHAGWRPTQRALGHEQAATFRSQQTLSLFALRRVVAMACAFRLCGEVSPDRHQQVPSSAGHPKLVTLDLAEVDPHMTFVPQLFVHYARRPLVYTLGGVPAADLVQNRLTGDISVSVSFLRRLQSVAVAASDVLADRRAAAKRLSRSERSDVRSHGHPAFAKDGLAKPAKKTCALPSRRCCIAIAGRRSGKARLWLGIAGDLTVPTGNADSFMGSRLPTFAPRIWPHRLDYRRLQVAAFVGSIFSSMSALQRRNPAQLLVWLGLQLRFGAVDCTDFTCDRSLGQHAVCRGRAAGPTPAELTAGAQSGVSRLHVFPGRWGRV